MNPLWVAQLFELSQYCTCDCSVCNVRGSRTGTVDCLTCDVELLVVLLVLSVLSNCKVSVLSMWIYAVYWPHECMHKHCTYRQLYVLVTAYCAPCTHDVYRDTC
jgi:hypothetical protein